MYIICRMKNTLPINIPEEKKQELEDVVKIIKKKIKPEFIILFGSYAKGGFVEYDETYVEGHRESYESDFDILVVTANESQENAWKMWAEVEDQFGRKVGTNVDLLVHNIHFVNEKLSDGVPIFVDIKNDGVVLFKRSRASLVSPRVLSDEERKKMAEEDYAHFMEKARQLLMGGEFYVEKNFLPLAAFNLHQATENFFAAIQMVFVRYVPKEHNLKKLEKVVSHFGYDPLAVFPRHNEEEKHLFNLLLRSYVDARYRKSFVVTEAELVVLFARVKLIEKSIEGLCGGKIGGM